MSTWKHKVKQGYNRSFASQNRFINSCLALGFETKEASIQDDVNKHIDVWITYQGKGPWGVDVKENMNVNLIWVEFTNVIGNKGWIYGDAKIIAIDIPELCGFAIVDRLDLLEYSLNNVQDVFVQRRDDAYKKKYTRSGRKDVISYINLHDLRGLETFRVWGYAVDF